MPALANDFRLKIRKCLGQVIVERLRLSELVERGQVLLLILQFLRCLDEEKPSIPDIRRVETVLRLEGWARKRENGGYHKGQPSDSSFLKAAPKTHVTVYNCAGSGQKAPATMQRKPSLAKWKNLNSPSRFCDSHSTVPECFYPAFLFQEASL